MKLLPLMHISGIGGILMGLYSFKVYLISRRQVNEKNYLFAIS